MTDAFTAMNKWDDSIDRTALEFAYLVRGPSQHDEYVDLGEIAAKRGLEEENKNQGEGR